MKEEYKSKWIDKNTGVINDINDFRSDVKGFVYLITNKVTGQKYIGKKILKLKIRRKPLKGMKRVRIDYKESDWKTYTGSSDITKEWKQEDCVRMILHMCVDKRHMDYMETKEQFARDVLFDDSYVNDNISKKFFKKSMMKYVVKDSE